MEVDNLAISNLENNMEENKNINLFRIQEEDEEIVPLNKSNVDLDKLINLLNEEEEHEEIIEEDIIKIMNALKINKDETIVDKNDKEKNLKDNIKNKNIAIEDKIKLIDVAQKYQISRYKLEEISGISLQCQRYWEKNLEKMKA